MQVDPARIRAAWQGRISGCQLGKPVELLSMTQGHDALARYLREARALPIRDYVPLVPGTLVERLGGASCRGRLVRAEPDDDINYTVLGIGDSSCVLRRAPKSGYGRYVNPSRGARAVARFQAPRSSIRMPVIGRLAPLDPHPPGDPTGPAAPLASGRSPGSPWP
jgi:hypothetical protein